MKANSTQKATKLNLLNIRTVPIRTFWITSIAFFLCFFGWFGIVPFMPDVVKDLGLTPDQKWNSIILAVSGTIIARLVVGKLSDKYGPRLSYTFLLVLGAIPVILIGFSQSATEFLIYRFFIGFIGSSFVITQFHTSLMFAPNIVGTANATSAGWGNLGGGANRLGMPIIAAGVIALGISEDVAWRYAMIFTGFLIMGMGAIYYFFTQDTPEGNFKELKESGKIPVLSKEDTSFMSVLKDYRVWILFLIYASCFGIELTVYGTMDDYLQNTFGLSRISAGNIVLSFALMNIFARTLGGYFGDKFGRSKGLNGRVVFLAVMLAFEGVMLTAFSTATALIIGIPLLIIFSLTVQMAEGATFSVVPFINKKSIGAVSGIVGAGGNVGAFFAAMFLKYKSASAEKFAIIENKHLGEEAVQLAQAAASSTAVGSGYFVIGFSVIISAGLALAIRFSMEDQKAVNEELEKLELSPIRS